ncbi:MAG: GAF domain-containing sensor histidine kinase [Anaerolineae bacterium]
MDAKTIQTLYSMFQAISEQTDWRAALDSMLGTLREDFIYDNVAMYLLDEQGGEEVAYARAVGRGKEAEADAAWGEGVASRVFSSGEVILNQPPQDASELNRLSQPYLLGLPLFIGGKLQGALVFVRFGGPSYDQMHLQLASLIAGWTAALMAHRALREARAELESVQRQMRLQDDFVSTISHELRTPLGFIKGYSTSLLRSDTTWDEATQREFLTIIDEETDRLTSLIENMLESARLQSRTIQFKFQPLRMDALIRDVVVRVRTRRPELQVDLDFDAVPPILGDGVRLSQVFENLFSNAMKYAPGSPISISMRAAENLLTIAFRDHGPGIPKEYLPFIFERFYRVPGERTVTGTGLGLYICKQIILAHRGKIWAESVLDEGTTFFIQLPTAAVSDFSLA